MRIKYSGVGIQFGFGYAEQPGQRNRAAGQIGGVKAGKQRARTGIQTGFYTPAGHIKARTQPHTVASGICTADGKGIYINHGEAGHVQLPGGDMVAQIIPRYSKIGKFRTVTIIFGRGNKTGYMYIGRDAHPCAQGSRSLGRNRHIIRQLYFRRTQHVGYRYAAGKCFYTAYSLRVVAQNHIGRQCRISHFAGGGDNRQLCIQDAGGG